MIFELLKILALISMFIDHIGVCLLPENLWLRIVGRLAFPIFAFCVASGLCFTRDTRSYAFRLLILAFITVPCSMIMHGDFLVRFNCVFGFAYAAFFVWAFESRMNRIAILSFLFILLLPVDYGLYSSVSVVVLYFILSRYLKPGRFVRLVPRWFFYWFYPVHQLILGLCLFIFC